RSSRASSPNRREVSTRGASIGPMPAWRASIATSKEGPRRSYARRRWRSSAGFSMSASRCPTWRLACDAGASYAMPRWLEARLGFPARAPAGQRRGRGAGDLGRGGGIRVRAGDVQRTAQARHVARRRVAMDDALDRRLRDGGERLRHRLARALDSTGGQRSTHAHHIGAHGREITKIASPSLGSVAVGLLGRFVVRHWFRPVEFENPQPHRAEFVSGVFGPPQRPCQASSGRSPCASVLSSRTLLFPFGALALLGGGCVFVPPPALPEEIAAREAEEAAAKADAAADKTQNGEKEEGGERTFAAGDPPDVGMSEEQ